MFKVQAHEKRTISWWNQKREKIDVAPPYQRKGDIWGDRDKAYLIDSILNEYDIPKLYFADFSILNTALNAKSLPYAVVDGRQRIEAIFAFFDDKVALNDDFVWFANPDLKLAGYRYSGLKSKYPEVVEIFEQFNLDIMSVITDDVEKIKDLFLRLNRSKNLTGAELRNAMDGIVPDLIRRLSDRKFFHSCVRFNTGRHQDSNVAAKLLLLELNGDFTDTKKKHLDKMVQSGAVSQNLEPFIEAARHVENNLEILEEIFVERDQLLVSHGLIPLYYTLVKNHADNKLIIRDFLLEFEAERKSYQLLSKLDNSNPDPDYSAFGAAVRSINDAGSLAAAYKILEKKFTKFALDY
ncbi:DUF262 domain-containing protein [Duganella sp. FT92W]|uniref:DUF262 domain-containing protein n=1 Tax=Pseudoduganella rivuli TaxID=2666085 RepID=A0A7X2LVH2_9BURK|nr:DUF262 domain-containing protein [Pseudoduganella rivuli]MRV74057.1 DUF262 domain-containing protein [Pseudoduganella rivuli]